MPSIALESKAMKAVEVAVAVIENAQGAFLIAKRPAHLHMGGYWEFPGGKLEAGESIFAALQREVREELALEVHAAEPLLRIPFQYPEKRVILHVWRVTRYAGYAQPAESQELAWVPQGALQDYCFPPANRAVLTALQLPDRMLVTGIFQTAEDCLCRTQRAIDEHGIRLVQFRAPHLSIAAYQEIARQLQHYTDRVGVKLLLNTTNYAMADAGTGLHLPSRCMMPLLKRPVASDVLLGASCHSLEELDRAVSLPVDYVTFSPIKQTTTHPENAPKGWDALSEFIERSPVPVYALGGMQPGDLPVARQYGAHGIAGISAWW